MIEQDAVIFGSVISLLIIGSLAGVRLGMFSAKIATVIMAIGPVLLMTIIVYFGDGDWVKVFCSPLLSLAFGPATYVIGRKLEQSEDESKKETIP